MWEIVVIAVAIALFAAAALADPPTPATPAAAPSASPPQPGVSAAPSAPTPGGPTPTASPSPVAAVDQIIVEEVGDYMLADRRPAEAGAQGGAVEAVELRYEQNPRDVDSDMYHAIEIHLDATAAEARVRMFANAMGETGFEVVREQPLRGTDGQRQGYFIGMRSSAQTLLLWSNENVTFSLGGGNAADAESFYELLPY